MYPRRCVLARAVSRFCFAFFASLFSISFTTTRWVDDYGTKICYDGETTIAHTDARGSGSSPTTRAALRARGEREEMLRRARDAWTAWYSASSTKAFNASRGVDMVEREVKRRRVDADDATLLGGLPFDVVVTHVLREENFPDPADLAVLRAVSRETRDAAEMAAREQQPVEHGDVRGRGALRQPRGAAVGARERLPVELVDVRERGVWRPARGAEVAARERLPLG